MIDFYAIVEILESPSTRVLGIVGKTGVVLGVASCPLGVTYAVSIDGEGDTVNETDLLDTGIKSRREDHVSGERLPVAPQRYDDEDEEPRRAGLAPFDY